MPRASLAAAACALFLAALASATGTVTASAASAFAGATQAYSNAGSGKVGLVNGTTFSNTAAPFLITQPGWLVGSINVLLAAGHSARSVSLKVLRNGAPIADSQSFGADAMEDAVSAAASASDRLSSYGKWVAVRLPAPLPVGAGDAVAFTITAARPFLAGVVNHTVLVAAFNVTLLTPLVAVSTDDGRNATAAGYSFTTGALALGAVPKQSTLVAYAVLTNIFATALKTFLDVDGADVFFSWLNANDGRTGVRWTTVGIASADAAALPGGGDGGPGVTMAVTHTSLETYRTYTSGVTASSGAAVATLLFRPPVPQTPFSIDDGENDSASAASFASGRVPVGGAAGFVRAVDVKSDTPLGAVCIANVTVWGPATTTTSRVTSSAQLQFLNNGKGATSWRSLPLAEPLPVYAGGAFALSHSCGGAAYTAGVRADDGAAIIAFVVETAPVA
jgi:hypothetical protein